MAAYETSTDDAVADNPVADDPTDACVSCLGWRAKTGVVSATSASVVLRSLILEMRLLGIRSVVICWQYENGKSCEHNVTIIQWAPDIHFLYI